MRYLLLTLALVTSLAAVPVKQEYVHAVSNNIAVYENRIRKVYEKAVFVINPKDRLFVVKATATHVKVQNEYQQTGWVERQLVTPVAVSRSYAYSGTHVEGYKGILGPINVFGNGEYADVNLKLDRSFSEALRENVDKETIARQVR